MDTIPRLNLDKIFFRNCKYEDIPQVMAVNRKVLPENYSRSMFLSMYNLYKDIFFVAIDESNRNIIGYIMNKLDVTKSFFDNSKIVTKGHIFSIGVLPEYRRRGIASALLSLGVMSMVKRRNAKEIFLEVRVSNKPAINLYKKFGMRIFEEVPYYYQDGESAYLMVARAEDMLPIVEKIVQELKEKGKYRNGVI